MKGSAFIIHNNTWSCSNEVMLRIYSEPVFDANDNIIALKKTDTLSVDGLFNATIEPKQNDACEFVIMSEDGTIKNSFSGAIKSVGKIKTIISIFTKTDKVKELLNSIKN